MRVSHRRRRHVPPTARGGDCRTVFDQGSPRRPQGGRTTNAAVHTSPPCDASAAAAGQPRYVRGRQFELPGAQGGANGGRKAGHVFAAVDPRADRHRQDASAGRHLRGVSQAASRRRARSIFRPNSLPAIFSKRCTAAACPASAASIATWNCWSSTTCSSSPTSGPRSSSCCTRSTRCCEPGGNWCSRPIARRRRSKMLGPELMARLSGGMVCRLEPAEYATRAGHRAADGRATGHERAGRRASATSPRTSPAQSRELAGALKRLQATSLAHDRPITLALAEEALAELIDHQGRVVKLADIEKAVCDVFGLEPESLQSSRKAKHGQPSADAGHVAGSQAHARRLERDRLLLRPPQPQHGHLGAKKNRILDGRRPALQLADGR